jgi:heterotetrameric sarcosine oxidase gamma subunit
MVERMHPLATIAAASPDATGVQLTRLPPAQRLIVRGDASCLGLAVPDTCRATVHDERALLWLGPDEFLLLAPEGTEPPRLPGTVDVSHRDVGIGVIGPRAPWVINAFCALDLHHSAFPIGMCTRTVFGKAEIILWRTAADTFRIDVARSIAAYVWACLDEALQEFAHGPQRNRQA